MTTIHNRKSFALYIGISLAIIILVNLVARNFFFRLDFTDNKMYSLSESSQAVVDKIDDLLTIKIYFSENLPGEYSNNRRYLQDILEEYEAYSAGNLRFEFYQPDDNEKLSTDAQKYGIQPVQLQVIENDKLEIKRVFMGMVFLYEDQREIVPVIQTTTGLEYEITTKIKKLVDTQKKTIGFAKVGNQDVKNDNITALLRESHLVSNKNLKNKIPVNVDLLLMNGVTDSLTEDEFNNIDEYIRNGGNLMIAQGRISSDLQTQRATPIQSNIFNLLDQYGLHLEENLVLDQTCSNINVLQNRGFFQINTAMSYPFFPMIRNFEDHIIVNGLEQIRMLFSSEITVSDSTLSANVYPLFKTSNRSSTMKGYFNLSPMDNPSLRLLNQPGKVVAAYTMATSDSSMTAGQIILVSDSDFLADGGGGRVPENFIFIMNAVDFLTGDSDLVALRSREITIRPLNDIEEGSKARWKWANILLPSILVICLGLIQWRRDVNRTNRLEEMYG